ncbi:hypothetical protein PSEUBRA_003899 [Kalmanozyma brasiliensis GHG001]|uniref:uncharacterized protein n=1 Tax=Kalmanozyma brasiliensis (strain GHG001) TaxID=1365824 RepID=UPI00286829D0|nr:uncharacterized protein PSEUBRA_003899 [Kalmanozyma brasiliensis GHG001]KAF6767313.1 hypothetical protein PSEUBRA_003899 [Kalmanozyma brasiliensis GHG001]
MSQPNTAAIAVAAIFGGIALVFASYKAYRKIWHCMHRSEELPPLSQPPTTTYHGGVVTNTVSDMPTSRSINRSAGSTDYLITSSASTSTWHQADGLGSTSTSEMPSPNMQALDSVVLSTPSEIYDPSRPGASVISSSSSTMTIKRSYLRSPSTSQISYMSNPSRRESYLPHSPHNRDMIQIVPPQPLGFGGRMAMASDQKTLAFSEDSGIGLSEDFTSGLIWTERNPHRPHLAQQERKRYLMEGPVSSRSSEAPSPLTTSRSGSSPGGGVLDSQSESDRPYAAAEASPEQPTLHSGSVQPLARRASAIHPQVLGAQDSPLQRLQSNAGQARPSPQTRLPSDDNSHRSDSDASPILRPFVSQSSPPSTGDGAAASSSDVSSVAATSPPQ